MKCSNTANNWIRGPRSEPHKELSFAWFFILAIWEKNTGKGSNFSHMDSLEHPLKAWHSTAICVCAFVSGHCVCCCYSGENRDKGWCILQICEWQNERKTGCWIKPCFSGHLQGTFWFDYKGRSTGFQTKFVHLIELLIHSILSLEDIYVLVNNREEL